MLPTIPFLFGALGVFRRSRQRAVRLTVFLDQVLPVFSNDFFEGRIVGERPDAAPVSASSPHPLIENALTSPRRRSSTISLSSRETSGISRRHARPGVWNDRRRRRLGPQEPCAQECSDSLKPASAKNSQQSNWLRPPVTKNRNLRRRKNLLSARELPRRKTPPPLRSPCPQALILLSHDFRRIAGRSDLLFC